MTIEKTDVYGFEAAIRGMRNPKNSWERSDSGALASFQGDFFMGENDMKLAKLLAEGGPVHAKYRRMITVTCDITAPLYWWKEFDTYKVGTVTNSCSTMHKIHAKEFDISDFSTEHLFNESEFMDYDEFYDKYGDEMLTPLDEIQHTINLLNFYRDKFNAEKPGPMKKKWWWQMIQTLPSTYNQKRTVLLNYETLSNIYQWRRDHKLDEWHVVCDWIEQLPYAKLITMEE